MVLSVLALHVFVRAGWRMHLCVCELDRCLAAWLCQSGACQGLRHCYCLARAFLCETSSVGGSTVDLDHWPWLAHYQCLMSILIYRLLGGYALLGVYHSFSLINLGIYFFLGTKINELI